MILRAKNLTKVFGGVIANKEINLSVEEGTITALIGPNGSGKTTFINQVAGVLKPTSGQILFKDKDITSFEAHDISRIGVARTFQKIRLFEKLTVIENVLVARRKFFKCGFLDIVFHTKRLKNEEKEQLDIALNLLQRLGLADEAWKMPGELPYGKRRALEIARALALEPKLLLLEEPAAGMTRNEFASIIDIIQKLKEQGITMLLVEHTMAFIRETSDKVYVLNFGEIIAEGTFEEIEHDPAVVAAYLGEESV